MNMNTALIVIVLLAVAFGLFYFSKSDTGGGIMNPEEFREQFDSNSDIIIDVRSAQEFAEGHLKEVDHNFNVMSGEFESKLDSLDKDKTYYLYCRSGNRSGKAAGIMKQNGFDHVFNIGGYQDLVNAGLEASQ